MFKIASSQNKIIAAVAAALAPFSAAAAGFHFDSSKTSASPGVTPSIFLTDQNVAEVDSYLATQPVKVVKVEQNLSQQTIDAIYGKYKIDYTFADYESPDAALRTASLVNQIKSSAGTGAAFTANKAYISNFALAPLTNDNTGPQLQNTTAAYAAAGVNMASEELYPGSPSYRSPASNNSSAPNIRSALFALPVQRFTSTAMSLPTGHAHVAYVDRFNNWNNPALDTDHDSSNGFQFTTANQLPSRGDFQAQILHYRLRGATAVHGLQGGVVGYTPAQFESDITTGWNSLDAINQVFADPNVRLASFDTTAKVDGVTKTSEASGIVYSGAFSTAQGKLVMLLSNLDEQAHNVTLPNKIGGKSVAGNFNVQAGQHELIQFGLTGTAWTFQSASAVFTDADRSGTGVPEPAALTLLGSITAITLTTRRRRTA